MITPRAKKLYKFCLDYMLKYQCPPTYDEMARGIGVNSKSCAFECAKELKENGLMYTNPHGNIGITNLRYEYKNT